MDVTPHGHPKAGMARPNLVALAALVASAAAAAPWPAGVQLSLMPCQPRRLATQTWTHRANDSTLLLESSKWDPPTGLCVDIEAYGKAVGSVAYTAPCHQDDKVRGRASLMR